MIPFQGDKAEKMPWERSKEDKGYTELSRSNFYVSSRWVKVRNYVISTETLCRNCLKTTGRRVPANVVDHIVPITSDSPDSLKFGLDNLQPLCNKCHRSKTRKDNSKFSEANLKKGRDIMDQMESKY